jgi:hypothetical protein
MALDDLVTLALLVSAGFFVALSLGLLIRYRRISQTINASSDVGRDLWLALEQRMKRQDERIIDVMGRLEVVQSRMVAVAVAQVPPAPAPETPSSSVVEQTAPSEEEREDAVVTPGEVPRPESQAESQPESQVPSRESQARAIQIALDETQRAVLGLLAEGQRNTRQLTDALHKSREHTARLMKEMFELGLVGRNSATKPFVYQLTDEGRRYLQLGT